VEKKMIIQSIVRVSVLILGFVLASSSVFAQEGEPQESKATQCEQYGSYQHDGEWIACDEGDAQDSEAEDSEEVIEIEEYDDGAQTEG
jgi:hypothetical protein